MADPFSPQVEFCGYTIPHPSEAKMNLRIQTYGTYFCHIQAGLAELTGYRRYDYCSRSPGEGLGGLDGPL
jgi:hypothetical protein